jgi:hypothetical protein
MVDWSNLKRLMFKNLDRENDIEAGHTRSGRVFREVHLANLFEQNCRDEGFYNEEEADLTDEENSEPARAEEEEAPETLGTTQIVEGSSIIPSVDSVVLSNQSNPSH